MWQLSAHSKQSNASQTHKKIAQTGTRRHSTCVSWQHGGMAGCIAKPSRQQTTSYPTLLGIVHYIKHDMMK